MIGKYVVVRTYSAGVHIGMMKAQKGTEVNLENARRIWSWYGANTLSEVSQKGVGEGSRISDRVPEILLTEAVEVIPCSSDAQDNLDSSRWP